jgi:hypothetical protein
VQHERKSNFENCNGYSRQPFGCVSAAAMQTVQVTEKGWGNWEVL